jgi:hypothetical protein
MENNMGKRQSEDGSTALTDLPEEGSEEISAREARVAANRLLALLEPFESKIPHPDFLFIADCHDQKRRITPSRLARLQIMAKVYANGAIEWLSLSRS